MEQSRGLRQNNGYVHQQSNNGLGHQHMQMMNNMNQMGNMQHVPVHGLPMQNGMNNGMAHGMNMHYQGMNNRMNMKNGLNMNPLNGMMSQGNSMQQMAGSNNQMTYAQAQQYKLNQQQKQQQQQQAQAQAQLQRQQQQQQQAQLQRQQQQQAQRRAQPQQQRFPVNRMQNGSMNGQNGYASPMQSKRPQQQTNQRMMQQSVQTKVHKEKAAKVQKSQNPPKTKVLKPTKNTKTAEGNKSAPGMPTPKPLTAKPKVKDTVSTPAAPALTKTTTPHKATTQPSKMMMGFANRRGKMKAAQRCGRSKAMPPVTVFMGPNMAPDEPLVAVGPLDAPLSRSSEDDSRGTGSNALNRDDAKNDEAQPVVAVEQEEEETKAPPSTNSDAMGSDTRRRIVQEEYMATNPYERKIKECGPFICHKPKQPGLRANVFVSKDCTRDLAGYIVEEQWGNDYGMLYKYLDYIFRCQIFENEVKQVTYHYPDAVQEEEHSKEETVVIFHTGLQRRDDHEFLFFVLKPNDADKQRAAEQRWRVPNGSLDEYCFSVNELMSTPWVLPKDALPKRTKFYIDNKELLFDDSYDIEVNWAERLRTNKERIFQELKQKCPSLDKGQMVPDLTPVFEVAMQMARKRAAANPRLTVAQGFVETKNLQKRVELLLPLRIECPAESGKFTTFALALQRIEEPVKKYQGMSLLTLSMAYANARLVGYVDSSWLGSDSIPKISYAEQKKHRKHEKEQAKKIKEAEEERVKAAQEADIKKRNDDARQKALIEQQQKRKRAEYEREILLLQQQLQQLKWNNARIQQTQQGLQIQHQNQRNRCSNQGMSSNMQQYVNIPSNAMHSMMTPSMASTMQYGYANRNNAVRSRSGGGARKRNVAGSSNFEFPAQAPAQLPFIDSTGTGIPANVEQPSSIKESISAPRLNFPLHGLIDDMVGINDDILLEDGSLMDPLDANLRKKGLKLELTKDTESELDKLKISRSENVASKYGHSPLRKEYVPKSTRTSRSRFAWPQNFGHYAQLYNDNKIAVRKTSEVELPPDSNVDFNEDPEMTQFLLQLSCLSPDCGPCTLKDLFSSNVEVWSVHLVVNEQMAVIRFRDESQLERALQHAKVSFAQWNPQSIAECSYLQFGDGQIVWQFQDSNRWTACNPAMGKLIEEQQSSSFQIICHETNKYFIEKYNAEMGRQTNLRNSFQRPIRRAQIRVWAQQGDDIETEPSDEEKAIDYLIGDPKAVIPTNPIHNEQTKKVPTKEAKEMVMNPKWELQTVDDDLWDTMATSCNMDNEEHKEGISGVWRWTGEVPAMPITEGLEKQEDPLCFVPDADDAAELFATGKFGDDGGSDTRMDNFVLCGSLERAVELNTFADECDADGNVKVFMCNVMLDEAQRQQLEDEDNCNVTNVNHIELVMCGSINLEKLKVAVADY